MARYCPYTDKDTVYLECKECDAPICSDDTFFCLVAGSRTFGDYERLRQTLDYILQYQNRIVIVSGGAEGTDTMAERYADERHLPCIVMRADWEKYGKKAGYLRNEAMHRFLAKQKKRGVVLFWDGQSRGTQHSFTLAKIYNNPMRLICV